MTGVQTCALPISDAEQDEVHGAERALELTVVIFGLDLPHAFALEQPVERRYGGDAGRFVGIRHVSSLSPLFSGR